MLLVACQSAVSPQQSPSIAEAPTLVLLNGDAVTIYDRLSVAEAPDSGGEDPDARFELDDSIDGSSADANG